MRRNRRLAGTTKAPKAGDQSGAAVAVICGVLALTAMFIAASAFAEKPVAELAAPLHAVSAGVVNSSESERNF